jgi:hypothetical protein
VDPEQLLHPYEQTLTTASPSRRREWAQMVIQQVEGTLGRELAGHTFEAHAGRAYLAFGLIDALDARGAVVEQPLDGLGLGKRLAAYSAMGCL